MTTTKEIITTLCQTLTLREDQVKLDTPIQDLIKDSMDMVELIAVLSNDYGVQPDMTQLGKLKTVQDIVDLITKTKPSSQTKF